MGSFWKVPVMTHSRPKPLNIWLPYIIRRFLKGYIRTEPHNAGGASGLYPKKNPVREIFLWGQGSSK
jgi:hypothetical protein